MGDIEDVNESDCCGNGCVNCVLNIKIKQSKVADKSGKQNILNNYTYFRLVNKARSSEKVNVWELHFKSCRCNHANWTDFILGINPGYHLMLRMRHIEEDIDQNHHNVECETKRKYLLRPYSPYWWDIEEMEFKILVNLRYKGPMSHFLRNLQIDDEVEFRGPIGQYEYYEDSKGDCILLIITQGVAVAPAIPIIENILNNDDDLTRVIHLACFENVEHIYFRDKLYGFQKYWNYKCHIYLAHELCDSKECIKNGVCLETCRDFKGKLKYKESITPFRLTDKELRKKVIPLEAHLENVTAILAGTGKFQTNFKELLSSENYGFKENNIYLL